MGDLNKLQDAISYHFRNESLLQHALIHPSYSNEMGDPREASNQRLEFLGDAVLELVSSVFLYHREPVIQEGAMTKLRASLVCEPTLAAAARKISLDDYIVLGKGEAKEGINHRDSVLSDAFESVIGAMYLDGGYEPARKFVTEMVLSDAEDAGLFQDAKTVLQEYISQNRLTLEYVLLEESGPFHDRYFKVAAMIDGASYGQGEGSSKKKAEQGAAYQALLKIKADDGCI